MTCTCTQLGYLSGFFVNGVLDFAMVCTWINHEMHSQFRSHAPPKPIFHMEEERKVLGLLLAGLLCLFWICVVGCWCGGGYRCWLPPPLGRGATSKPQMQNLSLFFRAYFYPRLLDWGRGLRFWSPMISILIFCKFCNKSYDRRIHRPQDSGLSST